MKELTKSQIEELREFEEDPNEAIRDAAYETLKDGDYDRFERFMQREGYWHKRIARVEG